MRVTQAAAVLLCLLVLTACASSPQQKLNNADAANANANLGIDYMRKGNNELALSKLKRALEYNPDHVNANWALGIVYQRLNEPDKAETYFQRAIDRQPRPEILNSYGVFLCEQGETEEAVDKFQRSADNPRYATPANALANAGLCLERAGKTAKAETYYRRALKANPEHAPTLRQLAQLSYKQGDYLRARGFLQRLEDVETLSGDMLLLGARIELAQGNRQGAALYLRRYNTDHPGAPRTLDQLEVESDE